MKINRLLTILLITLLYTNSYADIYTCSIKNVSALNQNGYFVSHGWKSNYLNREFTIDRESGKILNTTALKERLNNCDADHKPNIISKAKNSADIKIFTEFSNKGTYALFQMNDFDKNNSKKPYFYHTAVGMILSGTCQINNP